MLKKLVALVSVVILLVSFCGNSLAMARYLYQYYTFHDLAKAEEYDTLIAAVQTFKKEHPLLMTDEWEERIIDIAEQARDAFRPDFNSEYDPFDDITYLWFDDHRKANPDDNCVIISGSDGLVLSFYFQLDKWIRVKTYAALINGTVRITDEVNNPVISSDQLQRYETFSISVDSILSDEIEDYDSLSFRFYGRNKDDYFDFSLNDETLGYFKQVATKTVGFDDVNDVLWSWMLAMGDIVDDTIMPSYATRIFDNNQGTVYPETTSIRDYHGFNDSLRDETLEMSSLALLIHVGNTYFFPCVVESVHEADVFAPYTYWHVQILSEYGQMRRNGYIVIDYALAKDGWITHPPEEGETILVAATFAGKASGFYGPVFFLGFGKDIENAAEEFGK